MKSTEYQLNTFLQYVRTKQFCLNALKNISPDSYVHVPMYEIKTKYLVNPKEDIKSLVDTGRLAFKEDTTSKGHSIYFYKCLEPGYYDINLINHRGIELNNTAQRMMHHLKLVSLPTDAPRTHYFDAFLNHKELIRTFFNVDEFSGRVHTPISNFHRPYRKNILLDGKETVSIDVVTMQPLLLGSILKSKIGENEYSKWIDEGKDIYIMLQSKAKLTSRDEAKKRFFEILFSRPNEQLSLLFGNSTWIEWINEFKRQPFTPNPHTIEKNHSNLAWLLQSSEVKIMREVWSKLLEHGILFISVHDEIIVQLEQYDKATTIFKSVMDKYFDFYRLSDKQEKNIEQPITDEVVKSTVESIPKGKLYYRYELKEKFNLPDEDIDTQFEECFSGALWKPFFEFQSNRI